MIWEADLALLDCVAPMGDGGRSDGPSRAQSSPAQVSQARERLRGPGPILGTSVPEEVIRCHIFRGELKAPSTQPRKCPKEPADPGLRSCLCLSPLTSAVFAEGSLVAE